MSLKGYFALGCVAVILWFAYGVYADKQADIAKFMKNHNLDDVEFAAFKACGSHVSGLRLNATHESVPVSICACQAKEMVEVMLPGKYSSHQKVVRSMTDGKVISTQRTLKVTQLRSGYSPTSGFKKLYLSLSECISDYRPEKEV